MIIKVRNTELPNQIITCKGMEDLRGWLQSREIQRLPISNLSFFDRKGNDLNVEIEQVLKGTYIVRWPLKNSHNNYARKSIFVDGVAK